jgi:DNA-binding response OmpR family regulator
MPKGAGLFVLMKQAAMLLAKRARRHQLPHSHADPVGQIRKGIRKSVQGLGLRQAATIARRQLSERRSLRIELPAFRVGNLSVDLERHVVKVGNQDAKLSPKEYDLLRILVQHAGKVVTQKILRSELWDELVDAQYLRVYVRQLRRKIEFDPERPRFVLTETGVGYWLRAPDEVAGPIDT